MGECPFRLVRSCVDIDGSRFSDRYVGCGAGTRSGRCGEVVYRGGVMIRDRNMCKSSREWKIIERMSSSRYHLAAQGGLEFFRYDKGVILVTEGGCHVSTNDQDLSLMGDNPDAVDLIVCVLHT